MFKQSGDGRAAPLTQGSIVRSIVSFALPMLLGQFLQQLYNMADAWVLGNFADNGAFAAVSSGGNLTFLIIGFFNGIAVGGRWCGWPGPRFPHPPRRNTGRSPRLRPRRCR